MLLPRPGTDPADTGYRRELHALYRNTIRECAVSREERKADNRRRRLIFLTGSETVTPAKYNKIKELLLECTADTYSCDLVRFDAGLPPRYGEKWLDELEAIRDETHRVFHDSDAGLIYGLGALWARVYGMSVFKVYTDRGEAVMDLIADPSDIGVLNEGSHSLSRQEAVVHWYEMSLPAFRRRVLAIPNAELRATLLAEAGEHAGPSANGATASLGPAMSRIILSSAATTLTGTANLSGSSPADPRIDEDVVRCAELWIWDDEAVELCDACHRPEFDLTHMIGPAFAHAHATGGGWEGDYRVISDFLATERIFGSTANPLLTGEHAFYGLSVHPVPGYLWGLSQVDELYPLQVWAEARMQGVDALLQKQVDPPMVLTGISGVQEERINALKKPGGSYNAGQNPGADVKPFLVPMPPEAFAEVDKIYEFMDHVAGRRARKREANQRSGDQVMAEAMLSAGQTLDEAMRVEDALEAIVTAQMRLHRRVSKEPLSVYDLEGGKETEFFMSQVPGEFTVSVISHSASPVFTQQVLNKVAFAAQQKALDKDELIELLQLPYVKTLKYRARRRGQKEAEVAGEALKLKKAESDSKVAASQARLLKAQKE